MRKRERWQRKKQKANECKQGEEKLKKRRRKSRWIQKEWKKASKKESTKQTSKKNDRNQKCHTAINNVSVSVKKEQLENSDLGARYLHGL